MDENNSYYNDYLEEQYEAGKSKAILKIKIEQTEYYHLGDNISIITTVNGKRVNSGDLVSYTKNTVIKTKITEEDTIPDTGTMITKLSNEFDKEYALDGGYWYGDLTVHENGGRRYSDAYATWHIKYDFTPSCDKEAFHEYVDENYQEED